MHARQVPVFTDPAAAAAGGGRNAKQVAVRVQHPDGLLQILQAVCRETVQSLRVVQAAGVTVRFRGAPITIAQTALWVRTMADHKCRSGDGPIHWALRQQRVVTMSLPELLARWPDLAELTQETGIRSVRTEPLTVNGYPAGVFTLFSTDFDMIDPPAGRLTPARDLLITALNGYLAAHPREDHAVRLQRGLHDRQLVGHAVGVLMARHGVNEDRARRMLTELAGGRHSVSAVARALIRQHPAVNLPPADLLHDSPSDAIRGS